MTRVLDQGNPPLRAAHSRESFILRPFRRVYRTLASIREGLAEADAVVAPEARRTLYKQAIAFYMTKGSSW